jgi:hypothetical protein
VHHIIYLSRATAPFTDAQLENLLLVARSRNAELDVSGLLLYAEAQFLQVLEGEEQAIRALYEIIKEDPRHRDIVTYADKPIKQRAFASWAMAFHAPSLPQLAEVTGYLTPAAWTVDHALLGPADAQLLELLRSFVTPA